MPANKHTPGPWKATPRSYDDRWRVETGDETALIVQSTREANARLIAAAPELLAALELTLALHNMRNNVALQVPGYYVHLDPKAEAQIRAAIRKARGESEVA